MEDHLSHRRSRVDSKVVKPVMECTDSKAKSDDGQEDAIGVHVSPTTQDAVDPVRLSGGITDPCDLCKRVYSRRDNLTAHRRAHHGKERERSQE